MKSKDYQYAPKNRRGLSSIVGALLFVVLMVATFSVLGIALNSQTDIVETSRDVADIGLKQQQEKFVFNAVQQVPTGFLQVNLTNQGQNVAEMFTLVMTNKSDIGEPTATIRIPSATSFLLPNDDETNIVNTLDLKMALPAGPDENYDFKVISSLGTIKKISIVCDSTGLCGPSSGPIGEGDLTAQLFLDGPTGVNTKTSTVVMFIQNNGDGIMHGVTPLNNCADMTIEPIGGSFDPCVLDADDPIEKLLPGGIGIFKWDGEVKGAIDDVFTFCNGAKGYKTAALDPADQVDSNIPCDKLTVIDPNDCDGCGPGGETIILIDDLLIRPSIFMALPSPFGDTDDDWTGLWAVNLANPTNEPMEISKVTILAYPPGGNAQDVVFQGKGVGAPGTNNCLVEDIEPNTGPQPQGFWVCPRDNILMWQSISNPILLEANSTQSFVAKVTPRTIKTDKDNLDALIVQANVYSTFGSFGKSGYQSSMYDADGSIVNVYLVNEATDINLRDEFIHNINDMANFTSVRFDAVIADMDNIPGTIIEPDMRFIINIPREWTFENFISCDGFDSNDGDGDCNDAPIPTAIVHADGSTQIIGISQGPIGDGINDARKISFNAITAPVEAPRLYIMYILADGLTLNTQGQEKTIGPLNEVVLNVDP